MTHPHIKKGIELSEKNNSIKSIVLTDKYYQVQTICPECNTNVCYYTDGISKDHYCTACNNLVNFSMRAIPA